MFAIQFENSLSFHTTPVPEDEGSRFKLTDFIQRCKQINGATDPVAGPRPLGCSEQTSKTYFNYLQGSLSGFLRLNCQRFSVSSCPNTGTPAGNVCQGKYKNPGYLVEIFCLKCTNLKALLTRLLQRKIVSSYVCCTIAFIKIRYTKDNNEEIRNEEAFCPCLALHNPPRPCTACILTTPKEN